LGEEPERVFLVGGVGVDNILKLELLDRSALERSLDFKLGLRNLLVTFHPVTLEPNAAVMQMMELLAALELQENTHIIFTMPNADTEGRALFKLVDSFVSSHPKTAKVFTSLGHIRYLSCIKHVDAVVGNSSSGLAEVPSFKKATVNIGDRQRGRLKARSVIDCIPERRDIQRAIQCVYTAEFQAELTDAINPYGQGGASERIVEILEQCDPCAYIKKSFHDLPKSFG
jgi:GDP/UDP-N,N'-diacetylbacillosamine 2-epimerase (hydrolysing)